GPRSVRARARCAPEAIPRRCSRSARSTPPGRGERKRSAARPSCIAAARREPTIARSRRARELRRARRRARIELGDACAGRTQAPDPRHEAPDAPRVREVRLAVNAREVRLLDDAHLELEPDEQE